jgi:hypothetical protein
MGLDYEYRATGYGTLGDTLGAAVTRGSLGRNEVALAWHR